MNGVIRVREVRTETELEALRDEWGSLLSHASARHAIFLSLHWHLAAWAWRAKDAELNCLVAEDEHGIVAILPLVRSHGQGAGLKPRDLAYLTVPDTQFADMVCARDVAEAAAMAFARYLVGIKAWDRLCFTHLEKDAMVLEFLLPALQRQGLLLSEGEADSNAWLGLAQGWESYYASRSRRLKKGNNHVANRLKKHFPNVDVRRIVVGKDDVENVLQQLERISAASWKQDTGLTLDHAGPRAFMHSLSKQLAGRGQVVVWFLALDGQAVASEYQLHEDGQIYALRADYDATFEAWSPGTYLFWQLLMQTFAENGERYWMGPGRNSYKARWLEGGEPLRKFTVYNRTPLGQYRALLDGRIRPLVRRLRDFVTTRESREGK